MTSRQPVVAVTGCCGRIGRAVANVLLEDGWCVRGIDRNERTGLNDRIEFTRAELDDLATLEATFAGAEAVVHLAAAIF